jgi:gas vesicle protein
MSMQGVQQPGAQRPAGRREAEGVPGIFSAQTTCFLLGGLVGAVVALLFAPKSGRELRGDIADAARQGADAARERAGEYRERAGEYYEQTRGRATEFYSTAAGRAGEIAQTARQAAARRTETLSAAIEAGKRAYSDEKRRTESSALMEPSPNYNEGQS